MKGPALLLMAQVDDASGEVLGQVVERLEEAGAVNVQLVPSLTKKGRPGHLLFVDLPAACEDAVATILAAELGTWGYRVLEAQHKHFDIEQRTYRLVVRAAGEEAGEFELSCKRIARDGQLLNVKAEHDQLVAIQRRLRESGIAAPLRVLKGGVEAALWEQPEVSTIELAL